MPPKEIVLAYNPSNLLKDWGMRFEDGNWFYEQYVKFYCPEHKEKHVSASMSCSPRKMGKEPYYDLTNKKVTPPPRIYVTHRPLKGEWEKLKTVDDLKNSSLYKEEI